MGLMDKIKDWAKVTDEEYYENTDYEEEEEVEPAEQEDIYREDPPAQEEARAFSRKHVNYQASERADDANRVVGLHNGNSRSQVVFKKVDKYENVQEVADELNAKKIVVLNLETCASDISRRVLDFLCGVAYANSGTISRVAVRTYIITPYNVNVSGEMLGQAEVGAEK